MTDDPWEDDDYAECGGCGRQLEAVTPWKHNPCSNPGCEFGPDQPLRT